MTTIREFCQFQASGYSFGLTNTSVADGLRKLADDVTAGKYAVQSVKFEEVAIVDDFAMQNWTLLFSAAETTQPSKAPDDEAAAP